VGVSLRRRSCARSRVSARFRSSCSHPRGYVRSIHRRATRICAFYHTEPLVRASNMCFGRAHSGGRPGLKRFGITRTPISRSTSLRSSCDSCRQGSCQTMQPLVHRPERATPGWFSWATSAVAGCLKSMSSTSIIRIQTMSGAVPSLQSLPFSSTCMVCATKTKMTHLWRLTIILLSQSGALRHLAEILLAGRAGVRIISDVCAQQFWRVDGFYDRGVF
jgi:hypothetical protein